MEKKSKQEIAREVLLHKAGLEVASLELVNPVHRFGYRNKIEFTFLKEPTGLSLAVYERGTTLRTAVKECILSSPALTKASQAILAWLAKHEVPTFLLKSLSVRCNQHGDVLAGLFVREENFNIPPDVDELQKAMAGFYIFFSNPMSPASVITKQLYHSGAEFLSEVLGGQELRYGLMSFFQVNLEVFAQVIEKIRPFVVDEAVLDYYSGVGSISIALADSIRRSLLLENCEEAVQYAKMNIGINRLHHFEVCSGKAEDFLESIQKESVLILDPPRSGLHPKVVKKIFRVLPRRMIYLSCNIISCAENIRTILPYYKVRFCELYNFFPASPFAEFLIILDRK